MLIAAWLLLPRWPNSNWLDLSLQGEGSLRLAPDLVFVLLHWMENWSPLGNVVLSSHVLMVQIHLVHCLKILHILKCLQVHYLLAIFTLWGVSAAWDDSVMIYEIELVLIWWDLNIVVNANVMVVTSIHSTHLIHAWVEIHIVAGAKGPVWRVQSFLLIILTIHFIQLVHLQLT